MIPQYVIAGVSSPHLFGLWNEEVRRKIPIRHLCSGWDHLIVAEAALHGAILFEGRTALYMRAPKPGACLEDYGTRHLPVETLTQGPRDFFNQLEWCLHCVDESLSELPEAARPLYQALMSASMAATYIALRGLNLHIVPGAMQTFNENPDVQQIFAACHHVNAMARKLAANDTEVKS